MIVVTGAAGFIGSNLVHALNAAGRQDIVAVDDLTDGRKFENLADCTIADYFDKAEFLRLLDTEPGRFTAECFYHLGACSDTTEWDGRYMMENNFAYSRRLHEFCTAHAIPLVYASSAAVYGGGGGFRESPEDERPLNVYGYSKLAFDQYARRARARQTATVIGLRYFNVYGPREAHKGRMASVAWHFHTQLESGNRVRLFRGSHGYADGEQRRDFVHVDDVVDVTRWCGSAPQAVSGVYNCGTGRAETFNAVAEAVIGWHGAGEIEYVDFPADLAAAYQAFTEADLSALRAAGYDGTFRDVARGVRDYLDAVARLN